MTDPLSREIEIEPAHTAVLFVDVQNYNCTWDGGEYAHLGAAEKEQRYGYFFRTLKDRALPNMVLLQQACRRAGIEVTYTLIESLTADGRDRSLSQTLPGWNNLLLPRDEWASQIVPDIAPREDEIVATKTTDSALTGTNLRLILANLGISQVVCSGIFTDQCISSTVRSLADESFSVIVVEDGCAAASDALHRHELEVINMIYCHVMSSSDLLGYLP